MANTIGVDRLEKRIPMAIAVHISGHERAPGTETTFTENVSSRGARVTSTRRWRPNEMLEIASLPGGQPQSEGFVIGLEFLEPSGRWVVNTPAISGKPLQG